MIVGTAGHIDHGKTALVRALTGVDTDRLPEEKARGISIELGYAFAPLSDGTILGFVDVPGHEKFVHAMLAGATGIDFALLIVAADDGVMPQTREHLAIVDLLGVRAGAVALSKVDVVEASRVDEVARDVRRLLATTTALADAPVFPVSARTGEGVAALREHLAAAASPMRRPDAGGRFRLAVDRSFTLQGIGTVVTGTVHAGSVQVGDELVVLPDGHRARVRSLHAQNRATEHAIAGERCALNLAGVARDDVERGAWVVAPSIALETDRFDADVRWLADAPKALANGTSVHVHLGAAHVAARLVALAAADDAGSVRCQVVLARPLHALHGDRFVVRDAAATHTLGGGRVLDPQAPARYRRTPERLALLAALAHDDPVACLAQLVALSPGGVDLTRFARAHNVADVDALARAVPGRRVTGDGHDHLVADVHWRALGERVRDALGRFHAAHPDELGPEATRTRRIALPRHEDAIFRALVADEIAAGRLRRSGPFLHLPDHDNAPSPQDRALLERLLPRLAEGAFDPPWVRDLVRDLGEPEALVRSALVRAARRGEVFQVVRDLFYTRRAIAHLAALARAQQDAAGDVRAAPFRDATGLGRKRAIQVLEFFDRVGFTRRVRESHHVRTETLLGLDGDAPAATTQSVRSGLVS